MTRQLSTATEAAVLLTVTLPGYLIEIGFPSPLRLSSRGEITVGNKVFAMGRFRVDGVQGGEGVSAECSITFNDVDSAVTTLLMLYGVVDRDVRIWKFYGDAPTQLDLVPLFAGRGQSASGSIGDWTVKIEAASKGGRTEFAPREYITKEAGFNYLPAAGTVISFGGQQYVLEAGG